MRRKKEKHHAVPDDNTNCELQENVAYVTAAHNYLWSEDCDMEEEEKEEEGCEEGNTYVKDKAMDLEPASPELPCRQYLQEKEVCGAMHQLALYVHFASCQCICAWACNVLNSGYYYY